jgi:hypothetical protein
MSAVVISITTHRLFAFHWRFPSAVDLGPDTAKDASLADPLGERGVSPPAVSTSAGGASGCVDWLLSQAWEAY